MNLKLNNKQKILKIKKLKQKMLNKNIDKKLKNIKNK